MYRLGTWLFALTAMAAALAAPAVGEAAPSASSAVFCPWGSVGSLPLPAGQVVAATVVATPTSFQLVAPTGTGGWYGIESTAQQSGPGLEPAVLVEGSLRRGAPVRTLAHVHTWALGVAVADGLVVHENDGTLSAWNAAGRLVWHEPIGDGVARKSDNVAIRTAGTDVIALVAPSTYPNVGHIVGVDAATGRVNLRVPVPDLDPLGIVGCAADTLYVVETGEPVPGHPVRPGQTPAQESVVDAVSTRSDRLLWQRRLVFRSNCSQEFQTPYATPDGLLVTRAPSVCTSPAGKTTGTVTTELFAPTTGRVLWKMSYPWSFGTAVSNGSLVDVPVGAGRVSERDYATGKVLGAFRMPAGAALMFGAQDSVVARTCMLGATAAGCKARSLAWDYAGKETATLSAAAAGVPFAESGDDVYAYGSSASELVVYRLKYLGPPQG